MSLRNLVEDQCGTANSLVQLSTHLVQDRGLQDQGLLHPFQHETFHNEEEQASPFLDGSHDSSHTFRMESLLSEMRELEVAALTNNTSSGTYSLDPLSQNENVSDWANQYIESGSKFAHIEEKPYLQSIWSNEADCKISEHDITRPFGTHEFDFNATWGHEYLKERSHFASIPDILSNIPPYPPEVSEVQYVAGQIVDTMVDPRFSDSKFLKFMNQVSDGEIQVGTDQITNIESEDAVFSKWANEPVSRITDTVIVKEETDTSKEKLFSQWGNLPMSNVIGNSNNATENLAESKESEDQYSKELWSKLTERWEQLNIGNQDVWASEFNKFVTSVQTYSFAEENPMADKVNALEEGKKRLEAGDLPSAVLCFEAAVQQKPENVEGWLLLGRTQAENEQDRQAIAALNKCLELDSKNLEAWKEIAVCYTNENYQYQACHALKMWLACHPKYKGIVDESNGEQDINTNDVTSILTMKFFNEVLNLYLKAVQRFADSDNADADVQNGLGVLLTLNSDYEKALDCFETAVRIHPNDARLWNRLGATLANGEKPEKALEAYRKTLKLSPGFIRARYNLGITCVHLKMYKQAVEHLLVALNQQVSGRGIHGEKAYSMSESIWTTLRLALSLSDRRDLIPLAEKRDLNALSKEFNVSMVEDNSADENEM